MLHQKAPHRAWEPATRHVEMFKDKVIPEPETLWDDYATRPTALPINQQTVARDGLAGHEPHAPFRPRLSPAAREAAFQIGLQRLGQTHRPQPHQHHGPARKRLLYVETGVAEGFQLHALPRHTEPGLEAGRAAAPQKVHHPLHPAADPRRRR